MSRILQNYENQITNPYKQGYHDGVDIVGKTNSLAYITAHSSGYVVSCRTNYQTIDKSGNSYGNFVKIKHDNGYYTLYAHLKYGSVTVATGQRVEQGQVIGFMGATGHTYGAHLHFEVRNEKDVKVNPTDYINADLPSVDQSGTYQVYDMVKKMWLPNVKYGTDDYAGNYGHAISGVLADNLEIDAHDEVKKIWLPWVTNRNDYAGNLPNAIDGIRVKGRPYQVKLKNGGWLPIVYKCDDTPDGYAGIYGHEIDAIRIF